MSASKWAQIRRINRKLAKRYEQLRVSRGWQLTQNVGDYYILDTYSNSIAQTHVDPNALESELIQEAA